MHSSTFFRGLLAAALSVLTLACDASSGSDVGTNGSRSGGAGGGGVTATGPASSGSGDTGSGTGGGDEAAGGGEASGGGGGGDVAEPPADLYGCDLPQDCFMDVGHLGESVTPEATACVSDAVLAGEHAVLFSTSTPGPYPSEYQDLTVLLGDGTALWQGRSRCMVEDGCEEQNTTDWKLADLQRCDVVAVDLEPSRCGFEDAERCVFDSLESCVVVAAADFACEDASAP